MKKPNKETKALKKLIKDIELEVSEGKLAVKDNALSIAKCCLLHIQRIIKTYFKKV